MSNGIILKHGCCSSRNSPFCWVFFWSMTLKLSIKLVLSCLVSHLLNKFKLSNFDIHDWRTVAWVWTDLNRLKQHFWHDCKPVFQITASPSARSRQLWRRTGHFFKIFLQFYVYDLSIKATGLTTFFVEFWTLLQTTPIFAHRLNCAIGCLLSSDWSSERSNFIP